MTRPRTPWHRRGVGRLADGVLAGASGWKLLFLLFSGGVAAIGSSAGLDDALLRVLGIAGGAVLIAATGLMAYLSYMHRRYLATPTDEARKARTRPGARP